MSRKPDPVASGRDPVRDGSDTGSKDAFDGHALNSLELEFVDP